MKSNYYIFLVATFVLLFRITPSHGQGSTTFVFTYDASGNRTERFINLSKSAKIAANSEENLTDKFIEDEFFGHNFKIYPNPTKGMLKIEIPDPGEFRPRLVVYNLEGRQIIHKTISNRISTVNLSGQPGGIYIMKILYGQESEEWKIIKE